MREFIEKLDIPADEKARLQQLTPATYIGAAIELVEKLLIKKRAAFHALKNQSAVKNIFRFLTALFYFFS